MFTFAFLKPKVVEVVSPKSEDILKDEIDRKVSRIARGVAKRYVRGNIRIARGEYSSKAKNKKTILNFVEATK